MPPNKRNMSKLSLYQVSVEQGLFKISSPMFSADKKKDPLQDRIGDLCECMDERHMFIV